MADPSTLTCPKCGHEFELAAGLKHRMQEELRTELQRDFSKRQKTLESEIGKRQKELEAREEAAKKLERTVGDQVSAKLKSGLAAQRDLARKEVEDELAVELKARDERLVRVQARLKEAQKFETENRAKA